MWNANVKSLGRIGETRKGGEKELPMKLEIKNMRMPFLGYQDKMFVKEKV